MLEVVKGDIFDYYPEYHLVHCISADFKLGAGIAKEINKRFDMRNKLITWDRELDEKTRLVRQIFGHTKCILIDKVFNLITKDKYYHKPTYESMAAAINDLRFHIDGTIEEYYTDMKLAMPKIGCGLDKLEWPRVEEIIERILIPNVFGLKIIVVER